MADFSKMELKTAVKWTIDRVLEDQWVAVTEETENSQPEDSWNTLHMGNENWLSINEEKRKRHLKQCKILTDAKWIEGMGCGPESNSSNEATSSKGIWNSLFSLIGCDILLVAS